MKRALIKVSILTAVSLVLSGCGDSNSNADAPVTSTGTAFYIDSAVEGVTVTCGSTISTTDVNGQFMYEEGKTCMFSIGEITLRNETGLYQDKVVIEDHIQTAQFLQSMDYDGNPENGITIHPQTETVMTQNGINQIPGTDAELADAVEYMGSANIGYHGDFVGEQEAQEHMDRTMNEYGNGKVPHRGEPDGREENH